MKNIIKDSLALARSLIVFGIINFAFAFAVTNDSMWSTTTLVIMTPFFVALALVILIILVNSIRNSIKKRGGTREDS